MSIHGFDAVKAFEPRDLPSDDVELVDLFTTLGCNTDLATKRRWYALKQLHEADERPLSKMRLVRLVAEKETGQPADAIPTDERRRFNASLSQSHLPALETAGLVDVDTDRGHVWLTDRAEQLFDQLSGSNASGLLDRIRNILPF